MKKILLAVLLLFFIPRAMALTVRVATGEFPPYLSASLKDNGYISRIIKESFRLEGIEVVFTYYPWKRSYEMVRKGEADATPFWVKTAERERLFFLSSPIETTHYGYFYLKKNKFSQRTPDQLKALKIGITNGYSYGLTFDTAKKNHQLIIDSAPTDEVNLKKLLAGRIDLFAADLMLGQYLIKTTLSTTEASQVEPYPRPFASENGYLLISRNTPFAREIAVRFNSGLKKLKQSGAYAKILSEAKNPS